MLGSRLRWFALVATGLGLVLGLGFGALAVAAGKDEGKLPKGAKVGGVDVGGLTPAAATARVQQQVGDPAQRAVTVKLAGKTHRLSARKAKVRADLVGAVQRAAAADDDGSFIARGWRKLRGGTVQVDEPLRFRANRGPVKSFVERLERSVQRAPVDARKSISLTSIDVTESKPGRRMRGASGLEARIVRALRSPTADRSFTARTAAVAPEVSTKELRSDLGTVVTVDAGGQTARVFKQGKMVKSYKVATGAAKFPTPQGTFSIDRKEKNPVWNVPNSDWAGSLAGKTIPGGAPNNPLKARWVGISGPVGFHGTGDVGSIGSRASHGCVRMKPADVIDLYDRVDVGDTVYVAS